MTAALPTGKMPHTCHAQGCDVEVEPAMFMCQPHWFMVPPPLREGIKGSYRPGQEVDKKPSSEYLAIAHAAIEAVAHKESRGAPRKKPAPPKPVQLALFELDSA
jgi:hypothetical protein